MDDTLGVDLLPQDPIQTAVTAARPVSAVNAKRPVSDHARIASAMGRAL